MISRSTYEEAKLDIHQAADKHTQRIKDAISGEKKTAPAIRKAQTIGRDYIAEITDIIFKRLHEVGYNATDFYASHLSNLAREQVVSNAIDELVHKKYYGLTLPERIAQSNAMLSFNIRRSGQVGQQLETRLSNISRIFNSTYPFGAHRNWDTRLFLAEAVRLEHIIAKNVAKGTGRRIARWTLSEFHSEQDYCDELATAVDQRVVEYLADRNYDVDPHGVYFVEDIPPIPHPNCQCTIRYITRRGRGYPKKRVPPKKSLIKRIISKIFNR